MDLMQPLQGPPFHSCLKVSKASCLLFFDDLWVLKFPALKLYGGHGYLQNSTWDLVLLQEITLPGRTWAGFLGDSLKLARGEHPGFTASPAYRPTPKTIPHLLVRSPHTSRPISCLFSVKVNPALCCFFLMPGVLTGL